MMELFFVIGFAISSIYVFSIIFSSLSFPVSFLNTIISSTFANKDEQNHGKLKLKSFLRMKILFSFLHIFEYLAVSYFFSLLYLSSSKLLSDMSTSILFLSLFILLLANTIQYYINEFQKAMSQGGNWFLRLFKVEASFMFIALISFPLISIFNVLKLESTEKLMFVLLVNILEIKWLYFMFIVVGVISIIIYLRRIYKSATKDKML